MATRDETAKELARLVLEMRVDERENWWGQELIRAKWHPALTWDRMQELARQLLNEPG